MESCPLAEPDVGANMDWIDRPLRVGICIRDAAPCCTKACKSVSTGGSAATSTSLGDLGIDEWMVNRLDGGLADLAIRQLSEIVDASGLFRSGLVFAEIWRG